MKRSHAFLCTTVAVSAASLFACSSDDSTATPFTPYDAGTVDAIALDASDAGSSRDAAMIDASDAATASDAAPVDAADAAEGATPIDAASDVVTSGAPVTCTDAEFDAPSADFRGVDAGGQGPGGAAITFPTSSTPAQYTNRCVKIAAGQAVTFSGSFSFHPLVAYGGDKPTPIPSITNTTPDGGSLVVTFPSAGTFGFHCGDHPLAMFGAVRVVP